MSFKAQVVAVGTVEMRYHVSGKGQGTEGTRLVFSQQKSLKRARLPHPEREAIEKEIR